MGNQPSTEGGALSAGPSTSGSACPVKPNDYENASCPVNYKNPAVYNVYGQRINDPNNPMPKGALASITGLDVLDPKNNMPLEPNQLPCPGQRKPLSIDRASSTIPKGGTESTWQYPSPQMVFNGEGNMAGERSQSSVLVLVGMLLC